MLHILLSFITIYHNKLITNYFILLASLQLLNNNNNNNNLINLTSVMAFTAVTCFFSSPECICIVVVWSSSLLGALCSIKLINNPNDCNNKSTHGNNNNINI